MNDEQGVRLAKRHDALSLRAMRESGKSAADITAQFNVEFRKDGKHPAN
jgi:glutamyl-tRNA synthetase